MYIPPQAAVFLEIDGWNLIPVSKCLWLVMHWMYDSYLLPYIGQDSQYVIKLRYHYVLEWAEGTMAAKEAQSKKGMVECNGVMDEILSLAERYVPTHSPAFNPTITIPGLKLPYTRLLPEVRIAIENLGVTEGIPFLPAIATPEHANEEHMVPSPSMTLMYPFKDPDTVDTLPTPGSMVNPTLLPSDIPCLELDFPDTLKVPNETMHSTDIFGDTNSDINSSSPSLQSCLSPIRSLNLH